MRPFRVAGIGLLLALCLVGCVPTPAVRTPDETAAEQAAAELARQGRFDQAAQAYLQLAGQTRQPDHDLLKAAEAYRQEGALDRAAPLLTGIRADRLQGDEPARLALLRAEVALSRGDAATALQLTIRTNTSTPAALQSRLLELRARALEASHDAWSAARTRIELDSLLTGLDRTQNRRQIVELLGKLGAADLQRRAAAMPADDHMLPWVDDALGKLGVAVAHPQPELGQPVGTLLPGSTASVREGYRMPAKVALLLPLQGAYADVGQTILEGFFAAYADAARNHAPRAEVRVYDSHGDAAGAAQAYRQAVTDGAQWVVGPLARGEVSAVFGLDSLPVPLLALNHPDDKSLPASGASEFGLLPETEGAQAADHMVERGLRRAYVIVSGADFAQRAGEAFRAELEARGGSLAGTATLPAGVNYASTIAALHISSTAPATTTPASTASGNAAETTAAPAGDTGIFISMRPQDARLLLPQLHVARVTLPVFATSHVYAGMDDAGADGDLDGVEFCDAPWLFDAQPGLPARAQIAAALPSARGTAARLFAFGMDAWNLVPYLEWLRSHPGSYLPGASGQLTADAFGRVRRVLAWARFDNGLARPLSGSLQMDDMPAIAPPTDPASAASSSLPATPSNTAPDPDSP